MIGAGTGETGRIHCLAAGRDPGIPVRLCALGPVGICTSDNRRKEALPAFESMPRSISSSMLEFWDGIENNAIY